MDKDKYIENLQKRIIELENEIKHLKESDKHSVDKKNLNLNKLNNVFNAQEEVTSENSDYELQEAYTKLNEKEKKYQDTFDNSPIGIFHYSIDGKITDCNKKFIEILGSTKEKLIGFEMFEQPDSMLFDEIKASLKNGKGYYEGFYTSITGRKTTYIRAIFKGLYDDNNDINSGFGIVEDISARRNAELAAQKEKEFSDIVINSLPGLFFIYEIKDGKLKLIRWNRNHGEILGYTDEEMYGKNIFEFIPKEQVPIFEEAFIELTQTGYSKREFPLVNKQGVLNATYSLEGHLFTLENKQYLIGTGVDISAQKIAENAFKKEKELTDKMINSLPGMFYLYKIVDNQPLLIRWNKNHETITGYSAEELKYKNVFDFFPVESERNIIIEGTKAVFEKGKTKTSAFMTFKSGKTAPYQFEGYLFKDEADVFFLGVGLDISERIEIEKELEEHRSNLEELVEKQTAEIKKVLHEQAIILDNIGLGVAFMKERKFVWANKSIYDIFNHKKNEIIGVSTKSFYESKNEFDEIGQLSSDTMKKGETYYSERILYKKDKTPFWCRMVSKAVESSDLSKGTIWILEDISQKKEAEEALRKAKEKAEIANESKSRFLANMSHEIRTPMNAVLGFAEILHDKLKGFPEHQEYLNRIDKAGKNLIRLINDILDLSKIEAGRIEIQRESINPFAIIKEIEQIFELRVQQKGLIYKTIINTDKRFSVLFDEVRLRQILFNLVGNAVKYTNKGKISLTFKMKPCNSENKVNLIFEVSDTGIGIPKEQQNDIFKAFMQKKGQSVKKYGGTGLGLAITKKLVEKMDGIILVESSQGKGSTFKVIFNEVEKFEKLNKKIERKTEFNPKNIKFKGSKLLLVEDTSINREVIKGYLNKFDLNLIEATNGKEGVETALANLPDLILMDIQMPIMDGMEASNLIKGDSKAKHIPIIAITASAMKEQKEMALEHCDGFIDKPVSKKRLVNKLIEYLPHEVISDNKTDDEKNKIKPIDRIRQEFEKVRFESDSTEFKKFINERLKPIYNEIYDAISIDETEEFIALLKSAAKQFDFSIFDEYGNLLNYELGLFNLEEVEIYLALFEIIMAKVKN